MKVKSICKVHRVLRRVIIFEEFKVDFIDIIERLKYIFFDDFF
jgi:hypothetical protein